MHKMEEIDEKLDEALNTPEKGYFSMSFETKIRRKLALNAVLTEQRNNVFVYVIAGLVMLPALLICLVLMSPEALASQMKLGGLMLVACLVIIVFNFADRFWDRKVQKEK